MNKKSSLKKKSSLLPFLALPAAGALAGGAYYWQQNNGEDAGLSKQEKAKRLLRCLILGGATGLGAATAYTGGKMTYDNLIKDSSYKKKVTKNTLLKQLVKKSSKKRNLLKLLVKQAYEQIPEYDGNINSNYLISGGLGLLGGLGLYHFLNNEEAKKKGLGGYIGAGLTGLSAGLLGAGAYNQTQHGKLFDEKNPLAGMYYKEVDKSKLPKPTGENTEGKRFKTTKVNGKDVIYGEKPDYWKIEDDPNYVAPGSTTDDGKGEENASSGNWVGPAVNTVGKGIAGPAVQVANGTAQALGFKPDWGPGWNYTGPGSLTMATLYSMLFGAGTGAAGGAARSGASHLWNDKVIGNPTASDLIAQSDRVNKRLAERAQADPYTPKLPKTTAGIIGSPLSPFSYFNRVGYNGVQDLIENRLKLTPGQQKFVDMPGMRDTLESGAFKTPEHINKIQTVFKNLFSALPEDKQVAEYNKLFGPFEKDKTYSLTPEDFGGDVNKWQAYNQKLYTEWLAQQQPELFKNDLINVRNAYEQIFNPKPPKPSIGTKLYRKGKSIVKNTATGAGNLAKNTATRVSNMVKDTATGFNDLLKKLLTKKKVTPVSKPVEPKVEIGHPKVDAFLNGETVNKPEAELSLDRPEQIKQELEKWFSTGDNKYKNAGDFFFENNDRFGFDRTDPRYAEVIKLVDPEIKNLVSKYFTPEELGQIQPNTENITPKPEAPKPNPATGNNAPTSPLNKVEPTQTANWVNGESNFGGQLNKTYQEIFGGKPIGDQFVENSPVSPVKAPEVNPNTQGTSEAQKRTETAQNNSPKTEADFFDQMWVNREPRPGAIIDSKTGEEVVVNKKLYQRSLREDKKDIIRQLADPRTTEGQKKLLTEEAEKCDTILKRLSEGTKRFGKALQRGMEKIKHGVQSHG